MGTVGLYADCLTQQEVEALSFHQYLEDMKTNGWNAQVSRNTLDAVVIELTKQELGEGKHGLLNIQWENKTIWKFIYVQLDDNTLVIADAKGKMFSKAPLGNWQLREEYNDVPSSILRRKLGYSQTGGRRRSVNSN